MHLSFIYISKHLGIANMDSSRSMIEFSGLLCHFKKMVKEYFITGKLLIPSEKSAIQSYMQFFRLIVLEENLGGST